jgi:xanthine dehydrogenase accessory factor
MSAWIHQLLDALANEDIAMLVTVAATRGSTPREAGARMIVTRGALRGTIGGGHLEFEAVRIAREALSSPSRRPWLVRFPLAARLGQCCGGVATLMFQPVHAHDAWPTLLARQSAASNDASIAVPVANDAHHGEDAGALWLSGADAAALPDAVRQSTMTAKAPMLIDTAGATWYVERVTSGDFRVVIFGNGHVGRALVQVLGTLACEITWVDAREHDFPAIVPANTTVIASDAPEDVVDATAPGSYCLVMTHSHALDFELTHRLLARGDFRYLGLIGSTSKRAQFERRLRARDVPADALKRITCPIGSRAISSKEPGAIAISVATEILQLREAAVGGRSHGRARA